ncbi:MAG: HAD family phosphatase [Clostridia bacterium]|nr:HAD family phosphatase [Clostridia bacterium]
MENKKYYLFDLDGTLIDSMTEWCENIDTLLAGNGVDYPEDTINVITPMGDEKVARHFISLGLKMTVEEIMDKMNRLSKVSYEEKILLKPFVKEYLFKCKDEGISINLLTASPHCTLEPCLKRNGVIDLFDNLWSCSDFALAKSDVKIYEEVAKLLGTPPSNITFFDDNNVAIRTAKKAGYKTVGVYDKFSESFWEEIKQTADSYIYSFEEIENLDA